MCLFRKMATILVLMGYSHFSYTEAPKNKDAISNPPTTLLHKSFNITSYGPLVPVLADGEFSPRPSNSVNLDVSTASSLHGSALITGYV